MGGRSHRQESTVEVCQSSDHAKRCFLSDRSICLYHKVKNTSLELRLATETLQVWHILAYIGVVEIRVNGKSSSSWSAWAMTQVMIHHAQAPPCPARHPRSAPHRRWHQRLRRPTQHLSSAWWAKNKNIQVAHALEKPYLGFAVQEGRTSKNLFPWFGKWIIHMELPIGRL